MFLHAAMLYVFDGSDFLCRLNELLISSRMIPLIKWLLLRDLFDTSYPLKVRSSASILLWLFRSFSFIQHFLISCFAPVSVSLLRDLEICLGLKLHWFLIELVFWVVSFSWRWSKLSFGDDILCLFTLLIIFSSNLLDLRGVFVLWVFHTKRIIIGMHL